MDSDKETKPRDVPTWISSRWTQLNQARLSVKSESKLQLQECPTRSVMVAGLGGDYVQLVPSPDLGQD